MTSISFFCHQLNRADADDVNLILLFRDVSEVKILELNQNIQLSHRSEGAIEFMFDTLLSYNRTATIEPKIECW